MDTLTTTTVIKNGNTTWATYSPNSLSDTIALTDPDPVVAGTSAYYYVRVEDADSGVAWSSPVWVDFVAPTNVISADGAPPVPGEAGISLAPLPYSPASGSLEFTPHGDVGGARFVAIYSVSGREVARLRMRSAGGIWDGKDRMGHTVAPGVYMARLVGSKGGFGTVRKFTVLR